MKIKAIRKFEKAIATANQEKKRIPTFFINFNYQLIYANPTNAK